MFATAVDGVFALVGLALVAVLLAAALDARANRFAARLYAREFKVTDVAGCPTRIGNGFWFSCAAEVRRLHLGPAVNDADRHSERGDRRETAS